MCAGAAGSRAKGWPPPSETLARDRPPAKPPRTPLHPPDPRSAELPAPQPGSRPGVLGSESRGGSGGLCHPASLVRCSAGGCAPSAARTHRRHAPGCRGRSASEALAGTGPCSHAALNQTGDRNTPIRLLPGDRVPGLFAHLHSSVRPPACSVSGGLGAKALGDWRRGCIQQHESIPPRDEDAALCPQPSSALL